MDRKDHLVQISNADNLQLRGIRNRSLIKRDDLPARYAVELAVARNILVQYTPAAESTVQQQVNILCE